MRKFILIALAALSLKCGSHEKGKESTISEKSNKQTEVEETSYAEIHHEKPTMQLYAYSDSVRVYSRPNNISEIVGFLNASDSIKCIRWDWNNYFQEDNCEELNFWLEVIYNGDTTWISAFEDISTEYRIDTIKNLVIKNYYGYCEYGGFGCYYKSKVHNIETNKILFEGYSSIIDSKTINDSILIYNPSNLYEFKSEVWLYNLNQDTVSYSTKGFIVKNSDLENAIYFIRKNDMKQPLQIIKYDYSLDIESILFEEPTDSTFYCHRVWDGVTFMDYKLESMDTIEYITIETHSVINEIEIDKIFEIKIDNFGNCYYRIEK